LVPRAGAALQADGAGIIMSHLVSALAAANSDWTRKLRASWVLTPATRRQRQPEREVDLGQPRAGPACTLRACGGGTATLCAPRRRRRRRRRGPKVKLAASLSSWRTCQ
jgi:hypothetical protein